MCEEHQLSLQGWIAKVAKILDYFVHYDKLQLDVRCRLHTSNTEITIDSKIFSLANFPEIVSTNTSIFWYFEIMLESIQYPIFKVIFQLLLVGDSIKL